MKLLLDIGNARIKWAFDAGQELVFAGETLHRDRDPNQWAGFTDELAESPDAAIIANVAGEPLGRKVCAAIRKAFDVPVRFVETTARAGRVTNAYSDVTQLGVDRWAAIVGAGEIYAGALCVVDAGTAVTVDLVSSDGSHQGGFIVPGLQLMRAALSRDTGDIEQFSRRSKTTASRSYGAGRDTASAVQQGTLMALVSLINWSADSLKSDTDGDVTIVITGGDADPLLVALDRPAEHRPLLVLEGLQRLGS